MFAGPGQREEYGEGESMGEVLRFQQPDAWKEAHSLVLKVYQVTQAFPRHEQFGLVSQMRRAAVAVPANIAEGFKRRGIGEKVRFWGTGGCNG